MDFDIHSSTTGKPVARIENGEVFSLETEELIGTVRDGQMLGVDGEHLGHLTNAFMGPEGSPQSEAFEKALRKRRKKD